MHIGIIGTGYVGLVTGACFAEFGLSVTCVDKDEKKINSLKKGAVPFYEPGIDELVKRNIKHGNLKFTTNIGKAVESSLVIFIAVGTPRRGDGSADLKYVEDVAQQTTRQVGNQQPAFAHQLLVLAGLAVRRSGDHARRVSRLAQSATCDCRDRESHRRRSLARDARRNLESFSRAVDGTRRISRRSDDVACARARSFRQLPKFSAGDRRTHVL